MSLSHEALSANEAASVTGVPLKHVHRIVDAGLLEGAVENRQGTRVILGKGLVGLKLAYETAGLLSPRGRRQLVGRLLKRPKANTVEETPVIVDVRPMAADIHRRLAELKKARKMVSIDKHVLGGTPCFKDTRLPVHDIAEMVANGSDIAAILRAYPQLSEEQVRLATAYAEAYPRRGRPRKPRWQKAEPMSTRQLSLHPPARRS